MIICPDCQSQNTKNENVKYDIPQNKLFIECFNCHSKIIILDISEIKNIQSDLRKLISNIKNIRSAKKKKGG